MKNEQQQFYTIMGQLPRRLTSEQVFWALNCQTYDIPILVAARLLKPLGKPRANSTKYFCAVEVLDCAKDRAWLAKMTATISTHWRSKNAKAQLAESSSENSLTLLRGSRAAMG
jgi:hypothetical protein